MERCAFIGQSMNILAYNNENSHTIMKIKMVLASQALYLYRSGVREFLMGCNPGIEMWASEAVLELQKQSSNVSLKMVIPYESEYSHWPENLRERYQKILTHSNDYIVLGKKYRDNIEDEKNRYLVDHSQLLVAVYDAYKTGKSALIHTIDYAREKQVEVRHVHPEKFQVLPVDDPTRRETAISL